MFADLRGLFGEMLRFVVPSGIGGEKLREIELHVGRLRMARVRKRCVKKRQRRAEFVVGSVHSGIMLASLPIASELIRASPVP